MPYFYDPLLDKDKDNSQGLQLSSASSTMDPAGKPSDGASGGTPQGQSRFQNLDQYLNNNDAKGAGQQFGSKVEAEADQAKSMMDSTANQFKDKINSTGDAASQDQINQAIADPTHADPTKFQGWANASYDGPKGLADDQGAWGQYWGAAQNANTSAKLAGTESGRFSLLDKYYGRPSYNFGEKSLDNLLIQRGGGLNNVSEIQNKAAGLNSYGKTQAQELSSTAAQRAGAIDETRKNARSSIGIDDNGQVLTGERAGAIGKAWDEVNANVSEANAARQRQLEEMKGALSNGTLTDDQIKDLGIFGSETLYNLDPSSYLTAGNELNRDQVMSAEDRARIKALSTLAGVDDTFASGQASDPSKAYNFDLNRFHNDAQAASSRYASDLGQAYKAIQSTAPLSKAYLDKLDNQENPAEVMKTLNSELRMWNQEAANGNPYAADRIAALNQSVSTLFGVMDRYKIDSKTGKARSLTSRFKTPEQDIGMFI